MDLDRADWLILRAATAGLYGGIDYDQTYVSGSGCITCGAGATLIPPLVAELGKMGKKDLDHLVYEGHLVASSRVATGLVRLSGVEAVPVRSPRRPDNARFKWLRITSSFPSLYYVGATDASAFLITGPEGHIVLDGGYPSTAPMSIASIAKLGFSIKDVRVLLNSEPHPDHAGGLGVLQQASGAELWASEASAYTLASGGDDPDGILPLRALARIGVVGYPAMRVDHRFKDGDTIRLGPLALTAHITGGHTRGCTSWSFQVRDGERVLNVVSACDLGRLATSQYPKQEADLERSFRVLRDLPVDIWVTCHARWWGTLPRRNSAADACTKFSTASGNLNIS